MMTMIVSTISMKKNDLTDSMALKMMGLVRGSHPAKRAQISGLCEFYLFIFQMNIDRVSN